MAFSAAYMSTPSMSERQLVWLIASIQFVNVLDFMMVIPLGPDFSEALGIPLSELGLIGGSYTAAAAVAGLAGSFFLDRYDRRKALLPAMLGLALATLAGGFAQGFGSLLLARVAAGIFGGPATSISLSIVADVVPSERRGRAMGVVFGASSLASIFGVPAGLELARLGDWKLPFYGVGLMGILITLVALKILPSMTGHRAGTASPSGLMSLLRRKEALLSLLTVGFSMLGLFLLVPNLSAYIQRNLGYPRAKLGHLYMGGGLAGLISMRMAGRWVDRWGATAVGTIGNLLVLLVVVFGFIHWIPGMSVSMLFVFLMASTSIQRVAVGSLTSRVPLPQERARYMSIQSATQHLSLAAGSFFSTLILVENSSGGLDHVPTLGVLAFLSLVWLPFGFSRVERWVKQREGREKVVGLSPAAPIEV